MVSSLAQERYKMDKQTCSLQYCERSAFCSGWSAFSGEPDREWLLEVKRVNFGMISWLADSEILDCVSSALMLVYGSHCETFTIPVSYS